MWFTSMHWSIVWNKLLLQECHRSSLCFITVSLISPDIAAPVHSPVPHLCSHLIWLTGSSFPLIRAPHIPVCLLLRLSLSSHSTTAFVTSVFSVFWDYCLWIFALSYNPPELLYFCLPLTDRLSWPWCYSLVLSLKKRNRLICIIFFQKKEEKSNEANLHGKNKWSWNNCLMTGSSWTKKCLTVSMVEA